MDFYQHLEKYLTQEDINHLKKSLLEEDKHALLLNTSKLSDEDLIKKFPNLKKHPLVNHGYLFNKEMMLGKNIYHELGCYYIQEPAAMIVSSLIDFNENDLVLDLCAAPGGKTIQAALKMNNKGLLISNDLSRSRAEKIVENVERLGLSNVIITNNDFSLIYQNYLNTFDKIILDAPCSGSGMFRKDEKFLSDWSYNKVLKFSEIQKNLIDIAFSMLKPGGILSYSTCSYSYEENEEVVDYLIKKYPNAEIISIPTSQYYYIEKKKMGVHLFPFLFPGEGQYICQIKKEGTSAPNVFNKEKNNVHVDDDYLNKYFLNKYGGYLFGISNKISFKGLSVLREGFKIGEYNEGNIKYDFHYSHVLSSFKKERELNEEEVASYLLGNTIKDDLKQKGYILLKYKNIPVSFGKSDGNIIKNHYPKGLRKKVIL